MKKEAKDKHFIKKPIYEGGPKAMKQFVRDHLQYPPEALENQIEGTVFVRYDINHQGKVTDATVIKGIGYGCDEEAIRITRLLSFTVPKTRGLRVIFHKNIQIHFRLPPKKNSEPVTFQYNYIEKPKPSGTAEGGGYTITINL